MESRTLSLRIVVEAQFLAITVLKTRHFDLADKLTQLVESEIRSCIGSFTTYTFQLVHCSLGKAFVRHHAMIQRTPIAHNESRGLERRI